MVARIWSAVMHALFILWMIQNVLEFSRNLRADTKGDLTPTLLLSTQNAPQHRLPSPRWLPARGGHHEYITYNALKVKSLPVHGACAHRARVLRALRERAQFKETWTLYHQYHIPLTPRWFPVQNRPKGLDLYESYPDSVSNQGIRCARTRWPLWFERR